MIRDRHRTSQTGAPPLRPRDLAQLGQNGCSSTGRLAAAPAVPAAESTLGSHPCVALSSAQVLPEWINRNFAVHRNSANGDNPLNFVSLQGFTSVSPQLARPQTATSQTYLPKPSTYPCTVTQPTYRSDISDIIGLRIRNHRRRHNPNGLTHAFGKTSAGTREDRSVDAANFRLPNRTASYLSNTPGPRLSDQPPAPPHRAPK